MRNEQAGPERRQRDRTPLPAPRVLGRAGVRPEHARHALSLAPDRWYPVIEQPAEVMTAPLEGYLWLDVVGRPRSLWAAFLEVEG